MSNFKSIYYILFIGSTLFFTFACSPTKQLKENEYLLYRQTIKGNRKIPYDDLSVYYKQIPNRKFLGTTPYVAIYYLGKRNYDSLKTANKRDSIAKKYDQKIEAAQKPKKRRRLEDRKEKRLEVLNKNLKDGNWLMRVPGEKPVIYDSAQMNLTEKQMKYYLHSQGYFLSDVTSDADTSGKKISVVYKIHEGDYYKIKSIKYSIKDKKIDSLVNANLKDSPLKINNRYKESDVSDERERLTKLLKDKGYFDFSRQYIFFKLDSTIGNKWITMEILIQNPSGQDSHNQYTISQIYFNTDLSPRKEKTRDTLEYRGIHYIFYDKRFSKKLLNSKMSFHPGDLYNQSKIQITQRQLGSMDMYRFVNINFEKNKDSAQTLTAFINTSPLQKYQLTQEYGVNVGQAFYPGPFGNITIRARNFLKGYEVYETSFRYSIDAQYGFSDSTGVFRTQEYGVNTSVAFPQIFIPTQLRFKFKEYAPRTKLLTGYNFVMRPEYTRQTIRGALTYSWMPSIFKQYNVSPIDINIINSVKSTNFTNYLAKLDSSGNKLSVSFRPAFVTSFNAYFVYNNSEFGKIKKSKYFKPFVEIGGLIPALLRQTDSTLFGLQYFEFIRLNSDLRFYRPVGKFNVIATRINAGIARPFGNSAKNGNFVLPYEKYFFAGGSNSIRAWRPRRLGPGSWKDPINGYKFEQPGEILLEASLEYRFNIFSFFDGAVFADAGNTWTFNYDETRPGSQFKLDSFYKQIALGIGYGIRLNFSFLILRFDIGSKIYDPGEPEGKRFIGPKLIKYPPFGISNQTALNIGIGYPF
ncbi:BamA/TamA family outer membrane protein [Sporocytophaga myxococcoides]|uniref:translocation and assembly module lipoprotein TamL n=1 Tax=Sporocytophaga myxococcoides TaxID=153721 RepID=UPI0004043E2B|nr:BamA/TamA family outer membrane protein [Sporocytophaga myxococcoides]